MAGRSGDEFVDEDVHDDEHHSEDEGEGEDLFGDRMADDYAADPENDQYDPEHIDDAPHEPLSIEQRLAAERAMNARDAAEQGGRRRRRGEDPGTPGFPLDPSSPGGTSDADSLFERQTRRRLIDGSPDISRGEVDDEDDDNVPESHHDLTNEKLEKSEKIDARLEHKISLSFQQFLKKFPDPENPYYPDKLQRMAEENHMHLDVNFNHIQHWSPNLGLMVAEEPSRILPILNRTLMDEAAKRFQVYKDVKNHTDENEVRVAIHDFPVHDKIRDLNTKAMNKLVCVTGVATKRSNVFNQVKRLFLRCAKCNFLSGPFEVAEEKDLRPGACVECQSRGPWRVDRQMTLYRNYQKLTLQEPPSTVEPGKMPRSKEVILHGDQTDSVRPGDEVLLTGIYRCLYDASTNARTCFPVYKTELEAVHVHRKGELKITSLTDEQQQEILELAKQPNIRERLIASMAPSIYGMHHVKTAIALSMMGGQRKIATGKHRIRGDINTLIVGDPGLAKSQFLKYVEQTFPKAVYTTGKGASAVGLTAALTRDESGDWTLEGGAMVLADDGICLIDEFDKMGDQDRTSIHEAMEQQTISISKAGIVAQLQARCAVIAVANPAEGRYDPQQTFAQNVNLSDPILSRFDVLCVLRDESDPVQDERLADHVVCSHIRSHPDATADDKKIQPKLQQRSSHIEPIPQELLQRYVQYARNRVFPKIMDLDKEKLANFYKDIRAEAFRSGGAPMTARHIESVIRLAEANARMELRQHVNSRDLDHAIEIMLESFIQSQKHQVAAELRKKFKRYATQAAPMSDQLMKLMDKLFKDNIEHMRLKNPSGLPPDVAEVPVEMEDVIRNLERYEIDLEEAYAFMRSERFRATFRVDGEKLYRVV